MSFFCGQQACCLLSSVYILLILHARSVTDGCSLHGGPACLSLARSAGPNGWATDRTAWPWPGPLGRMAGPLTGLPGHGPVLWAGPGTFSQGHSGHSHNSQLLPNQGRALLD